MAEDVFKKRKQALQEALEFADSPIGRVNPMRGVMKPMREAGIIKPGPDPTYDAPRRRKK